MNTLSAAVHTAAKSGEALKSGPWGLAIILLLCIACYFLFKSMSRHLKRVREDFPTKPARQPPAEPPAQPAPSSEQQQPPSGSGG